MQCGGGIKQRKEFPLQEQRGYLIVLMIDIGASTLVAIVQIVSPMRPL